LSGATFAAGLLLLASGSTPSVHSRLRWLDSLLPLGVIELSHFMGSVAGVGLLVLAWAIRRRLDVAYSLTVGLLVLGIGTSLLKGLDWEEALALAVVLGVIVPCRREFYRKAALTSEPFSPGWTVAVTLVVLVAAWLGFFSYKHVQYSDELWWRFTTHGDAPRFLRATVGSLAALLVFALMRLFRMARIPTAAPAQSDLDVARTIAARSRDSTANLALLGDKALLFSDDREAFIMYGVSGRSWVALGDPVGPPSRVASSPGRSASSPTGTAAGRSSTRPVPSPCRCTSTSA
jgi:phosphatidylglycerol lysyltransferase